MYAVAKIASWKSGGASTKMMGAIFNELPFGAIIGSVEIAGCVQNHPSIWAEKGAWNWVLANPVMFPEPITGG